MNRRTKALDITPKTKAAVWARDGECCVLCGDHNAAPNAHYIARSQGGLGIERNIVTLCRSCHYEYDNTYRRPIIRDALANHLRSLYPDWDESNLVYRKWEQC